MRLHRHFLAGLVCLLSYTSAVRAEAPTSPLRLIPAEADLLIQIKSPRQLLDMVTNLELVKELQKFPTTQEAFQSTQVRRFLQLLAYYEKELGAKYPDLLERLTAGGVALGVKLGPNPPPALLVIQGKDAKLTRQSVEIVLKVAEQELQRQESPLKLEKGSHQGIDVVHVGKDFFLATVGSIILVSNNDKALQKALDLHQGREKRSLADSEAVAEAMKLLPGDVLVSAWLNMETVRMAPGAKAFYKTPREAFQAIFFGGYLDVLGRTPFVCAGMQRTPDGFLTTIRAPRGREGMGAERVLHLPADASQPATLPLLEPRGVLYADSFYLDVNKIWEDRAKLFPEAQVKAMERFDKDGGRFPVGNLQLSKLLTSAGSYHRVVVVNQPRVGYKTQPRTSNPAFAFVTEMRDPDAFGRAVETALRGIAFIAGTQIGLKLVEEKYKDCNLVGFRFPEDKPLKADVSDIRFNYSPCFTRVGKQFVLSSTIELCKELVEVLQQQDKEGGKSVGASSYARIYSGGIAEILRLFEDQLVTQAILDQAVPATEARQQVRDFLELLHRQGTLDQSTTYTSNESRYDIRFRAPNNLRNPNQDTTK